MAKKDKNKGKIKIVNKATRETRYVPASKVQNYTDDWDIYAFKDTPASIAYLKKKGLIE